jgi:hypothetical protein
MSNPSFVEKDWVLIQVEHLTTGKYEVFIQKLTNGNGQNLLRLKYMRVIFQGIDFHLSSGKEKFMSVTLTRLPEN